MNKNISLKESIAVLIVLFGTPRSTDHRIPALATYPDPCSFHVFVVLWQIFKSSHGMRSMTGSSKESPRGSFQSWIFLLIGVLVASWILSGTIPTIMVYGFKLCFCAFFTDSISCLCNCRGDCRQFIYNDFDD